MEINKDIHFFLTVITLACIAYIPIWAFANINLWMPEWIAIPLFTAITTTLDATYQTGFEPLYTPPPEEAIHYFVLDGMVSSGNQSFNITATLEQRLGERL